MKRTLSLLLTAALLLTACATGGATASSTGRVGPASGESSSRAEAVSSSVEAGYPAEFPPAEQPLPLAPSDEGASPPASVPEAPAAGLSLDQLLIAEPQAASFPVSRTALNTPDEVAAVWISYLEFLNLAKNQSKSAFTDNVDRVFQTSADYGLNTVFVQVRPFGDALYRSDYFPWSYVLTGEEGVDPGYDPLAVMCELADRHGLRIEAWINPYRIRAAGSPNAICADNRATKYLRDGSDAVIQFNGGVSYNPASKEARNLITLGVMEIVQNYDIDGIHFDDYFYPTTDPAFDSTFYAAYQNAGGTLSQGDWRRENVNALVRQVYVNIKNIDPGVIFGISPQARVDVNYGSQYADVEKWLSNTGYVDYICPQIYFGFEHETVPYNQTLDLWNRMAAKSGTDLYVGLAVYKSGVADNGAKSGSAEWQESTDMLQRMVREARRRSEYAGFVLYRYDSLFNPAGSVSGHIAVERSNLAAVIG